MGIPMEQKEFLKIIQSFRRRMNIADFLKKSVFALSVGAGAGILFQAAAFFVPFYYAGLCTILALLLAEMSVFVVMFVRRTTMEEAALRMDGFGFEERIVTAYEHLDKEGTFIRLQREDAISRLREHKDKIRIPIRPSGRKMCLLLFLLMISVGLSLLPSGTKERAGELHKVREEAKEKEDEIEEMIEALDEMEQEELTKEQQDLLREMTESLESSLADYQQADSEQALSAASQKLSYKYEDMSSRLSDMIRDIQDGAGVSVVSADALQEMADRLKNLSDMRQAKNDGAGNGQSGQNSAGNGQSGQDGQGGDGAGSGQGGAENGQGQGAGDGNGQDGQSGAGNGQGGSGEGNGNGNDQDGQGSGSGGGSGNGRGDGASSTPHDYVSVPNAVADSGNLTGNADGHELSEYFRAQTGLNWEGAHTSYEAAIGSYEQNAYEGIAAGRYPSGMEDIIKEYFSSFNN